MISTKNINDLMNMKLEYISPYHYNLDIPADERARKKIQTRKRITSRQSLENDSAFQNVKRRDWG